MSITKTQLGRFRTLLAAERRLLIERAGRTLEDGARFDPNDLPDEIDLASAEYHQGMVLRLRGRELYYLGKIDRALQKIDAGQFGVCEECDQPIPLERLHARPVALLCVKCKEGQERVERDYRG